MMEVKGKLLISSTPENILKQNLFFSDKQKDTNCVMSTT